MYTVALIPARSGSKGVPGKNIRELAGHPLIAYSIKVAQKCSNIDQVIVSTNSEQYSMIADAYGADVIMRPDAISSDASTDYDFIAHALDWMVHNGQDVPDMLVHLRPTTPLRSVSVVQAAIEVVKAAGAVTALRSVQEMPESAYKCFEIRGDILKSVYTNSNHLDEVNNVRQAYPVTYQGNGYVDVLLPSTVRQLKRIHGYHVLPFITPRVVEVDTEEDFALLEYQVEKYPEIVAQLFG
jgi:N-acylneuraminate cytidylyltransferase